MSEERAKELGKLTKDGLVENLMALEQYVKDLEQAKISTGEPMVQWTIKVTAPRGLQGNPDFVTLKYADFDTALKEHHQNKALLAQMGYKGAGGSGSEAPSPEDGLERDELRIGKFELERLPDGRMKLKLFGHFEDGGLHRYPDIQFTGNETDVWDVLRGVDIDTAVHPVLPVEEEIAWVATYKQGRPKQSGAGHYLDLVKLRVQE